MWKSIILDVECIVCNKTLQKIKHDPREVSRKMVRISTKRARTPNWSPEEKQFLLELIKEHKEVVVTKNNNGPNHSEEKDVAWNEILRQLAVKFGNKFFGLSTKKVKTQWQNMKRITREEIALNGDVVNKYSKQSMEVCTILDLVKDGILKKENEVNDTTMSANVEIKTECIDEDPTSQPSCSSTNLYQDISSKVNDITKSSSSSEIAEIIADDPEMDQENMNNKRSKCTMTEPTLLEDNIRNVVQFNTDMHEFLKFSATEKHLKMESLKEERQVFRAVRETAELNKIIAEQKLKHILWMKNQEMS
ncbi:jg22038 [Pararge aegeria aegeria]|uniref:Regulatory protein zeste n=1 Tax=Pararge aegeria aegeria TaxID=348720 RepID=A0A8S4RHG3_9NEOP|nr:jg22038 [Pararge aegeria aegeria]